MQDRSKMFPTARLLFNFFCEAGLKVDPEKHEMFPIIGGSAGAVGVDGTL